MNTETLLMNLICSLSNILFFDTNRGSEK